MEKNNLGFERQLNSDFQIGCLSLEILTHTDWEKFSTLHWFELNALYYILNVTANSTILITQVPKVLNNNTKTPLKTVTPELQCGSVNSPHSTMAFHREVNFGLVLHTLKAFNKLDPKFCIDALKSMCIQKVSITFISLH